MPYTPYLCNITAITQGNPAVVTTQETNAFVVGNLVTFQIPKVWGMWELDGLKGYVVAVTSNTVTVEVDTSNFLPFANPGLPASTVINPAQILPIGSANTGYQANGNVQPENLTIPGAFEAPDAR